MSKRISDLLPETEILTQLAEEASELAQAALKLRRALDGANPTPKTKEECRRNLKEEVGDILNCIYALEVDDPDAFELYVTSCWKRANTKYARWLTRLEKKEYEKRLSEAWS